MKAIIFHYNEKQYAFLLNTTNVKYYKHSTCLQRRIISIFIVFQDALHKKEQTQWN